MLASSGIGFDEFNSIQVFIYFLQPEGKRPLRRPRRRLEDDIKINLQETGGGCVDWMELAQDMDRWRALVSR